jgi:hypothetical protein
MPSEYDNWLCLLVQTAMDLSQPWVQRVNTTSISVLPGFPQIHFHYFVTTDGAGERRGVLTMQITNHHLHCTAKVPTFFYAASFHAAFLPCCILC